MKVELKPTRYYKNIYTINYDLLKKENIKYLLFDLDNYEHFRWNRNVDILKGYHSLIVVMNVYN